jgi:hypothetical protein
MLVVLMILQKYWMGLIVKAAIRQSQTPGSVEDVREDAAASTIKEKQN